MPITADFSISLGEAGGLTFALTPPGAIGGQTIGFFLSKRLGGTDYIMQKYTSSGFVNVSGINITNSGQGVLRIDMTAQDTSGLNPGVYSYYVKRLDPGFETTYSEGHLILNW